MKKKVVLMLLAGALATGQVTPVLAADAKDDKIDKSETVYVKAKADGTVKETKVNDLLDISGKDGDIEDYSTLTDIKNKEGDEEYTQSADGSVIWENHGENISYEGKSDKELPVDVKVSYYLDGKKMSPKDMIGKSGKVKIRFDYDNKTSETVSVDGKNIDVKVPFMALSAMTLPADTFSNIQVSNGKNMADKNDNIVMGVAFPGLSDSLKLEDYEETKDVDIPDYVEVTADVENFELEYTATIITTPGLDEMDTDDLNDVDDLVDGVDSLTDASSALKEGAAQLSDGLTTFQSYLSEYNSGVSALSEGMNALTAGLKELDTRKAYFSGGAAQLNRALTLLNDLIANMQIPQDMSEAETAAKALKDDVDTLGTQLTTLKGKMDAAEQSVSEMNSSLDTAIANAESDAEEQAESQVTGEATKQMQEKVQSAMDSLDATGASLTADQKKQIMSYLESQGQISVDIKTIDLDGDFKDTKEHLNKLSGSLKDASEISEEVTINAVKDTVDDMQTQVNILQKNAGGISYIGTGLQQITEALTDASDSSEQLAKGLEAYGLGVAQAYKGSAQLESGTTALNTAGAQLFTGYSALVQGGSALSSGVDTFDKEGIQKIADLAGDDLINTINRFKAVKEADGRYTNYSGIKEGQKGEVKFIVETKELKAKE